MTAGGSTPRLAFICLLCVVVSLNKIFQFNSISIQFNGNGAGNPYPPPKKKKKKKNGLLSSAIVKFSKFREKIRA